MEIAEIARKLYRILNALDLAESLTWYVKDSVRLPNQAEIRGFVENKEFLCEIYLDRPDRRPTQLQIDSLFAQVQSDTSETDCALKNHEADSSTLLKLPLGCTVRPAQVDLAEELLSICKTPNLRLVRQTDRIFMQCEPAGKIKSFE